MINNFKFTTVRHSYRSVYITTEWRYIFGGRKNELLGAANYFLWHTFLLIYAGERVH